MIFIVVAVVVAFFLPLDFDVLSRKGDLLELRCSSVLLCTWKPNALLTFARRNFLDLYLHELAFSEDKPLAGV
jgi:hypothetical protein